jgi:hypothetical protein
VKQTNIQRDKHILARHQRHHTVSLGPETMEFMWATANDRTSRLAQSVQWLGYSLDYRSPIPSRGRIFLFTKNLYPRWSPPSLLSSDTGTLSSGHKVAGLGSWPPTSNSVEVKKAWSYASSSPNVCKTWCLVKHGGDFTSMVAMRNVPFKMDYVVPLIWVTLGDITPEK